MTQDDWLELYVELEDMGRRIRNMKHRVGEFIGRDEIDTSEVVRQARIERILAAVRETDAAPSLSSGLPCPNDYPIPNSDGHLPTPAHICCEACDDLD